MAIAWFLPSAPIGRCQCLSRLAEVLFIQVLRAHIASGPERNKGWLRAVFDPQVGTALSAIHDSVHTPWTVESLAEAAGMSRSAFAARFKELLGQTPLEYVTEWRMQKAMQLLQQRDKKLIKTSLGRSVTSPTLRSVRRSSELSGPGMVNTSSVVLKATVRPELRTLLEAGDSDFGDGAQVLWKCVLPMEWVGKRHSGPPCFPYSVISMVCFSSGNAG